jgi:multicomponent K+:H+ antiporter subunit A
VLTRPRMLDLSSFFVEHSLPQAGGGNVVNVILVDFRAFDTFGEITVVGIVALTVYALLRRFRPAVESVGVPRAQREDLERRSQLAVDPNEVLPSGFMMVPAVLVRLLLPMAGLVSLFFLLRGHNLPGGGFIGGLVLATAVIVQYMVGGALWVEARTRLQPLYWIATGLLAAGTAGVAAWFASRTFLTSLSVDVHLPLIGDVHLSSTLWFDIGVYMLVVGATVLMLVALAHQSLRSYRRPVVSQPESGLRVETPSAKEATP